MPSCYLFFQSADILALFLYFQAQKAGLVSSGNTELYNAIHCHMVNKRLLTKDLKNDMTLESMYNKQGLYINHYSNGVCFFFHQIHSVYETMLLFIYCCSIYTFFDLV